MKVEQSLIRKVSITEVNALDRIDVMLEDFGKGHGQITIRCYGKSWTSYWGGMGDRKIDVFVCGCDNQYLIGNLDSALSDEVTDGDQLEKDAEAKGVDVPSDVDPSQCREFLAEMYGNDPHEWWYSMPKKPNPDYIYLSRILDAVKDALRSLVEAGE